MDLFTQALASANSTATLTSIVNTIFIFYAVPDVVCEWTLNVVFFPENSFQWFRKQNFPAGLASIVLTTSQKMGKLPI